MEFTNQILYLAALIMLFGMAFSAFRGVASSIKSDESIYFWFFGLVVQMISFAGFYLYPYVGEWALVMGNTGQLAVDLLLAMLFRSFRAQVPKFYVLTVGWVLIIFAVAVSSLSYIDRMLLVCIATIGVSIWQLYELFRAQKSLHSIFILFLQTAISLQILLCASRVILFHAEGANIIHSLMHQTEYDDDSLEIQIRMLLVFLYVLIFMGIGNFYFEKIWRISENMIHVREDQMLETLQSLATSRDNETGQHLVRTQAYVKLLCYSLREMGCYGDILIDSYIEQVVKVTPLHDIGKVGIPDEILLKEGPHTDAEREVMKSHAALGERILTLSDHDSDDAMIQMAAAMAGSHHERWDGTGYPRGLKGTSIPLAARIMSLADVYDALTTSRIYKKAWPHEDAVTEIGRQKGKAFDPTVVEAFMRVKDDFHDVAEQMKG